MRQIQFRYIYLYATLVAAKRIRHSIALCITCVPLLYTYTAAYTLLHIHCCYTVTSAECLSLPSSRHDVTAQRKQMRLPESRCLPSCLLLFPISGITIFLSYSHSPSLSFFSRVSIYIQWRKKASGGPDIFRVLSQKK